MPRPTVDSLFETVYPGLLARFDALGGDRIDPWVHVVPTFKADADGTIVMAQAAVRRVFLRPNGHRCVLNIAFRCRRQADRTWEPMSVSFHCGPDPDAMDEVHFRIDSNKAESFHCHIRGYGPKPEKGGHLPASTVIPRPTLSPFDFLGLVDSFLRNDKVPLSAR